MAYLVEEMDRSAIGLAMGLYIAGNTLGGMGGRLASAGDRRRRRLARAPSASSGSFRSAAPACSLFALPKERAPAEDAKRPRFFRRSRMHFSDPGLRYLFAMGFLLMGAFVATYNYIGFRLEAPPFSLSPALIGFVYCIYLVGAVSSTVMGELAGRYGRRRVIGFAIAFMPIGVVLTLPDNLWLVILGVGVVTVGFFGGHSIASSWVGLRAETAKAQASALYLFFYYAGSKSSRARSAAGSSRSPRGRERPPLSARCPRSRLSSP